MADTQSVLERYPEYEITIGIEVHVQLNTASKIFCRCPNSPTPDANQNICPICCGHPGVLPVLNKEVVNGAIKAGLGTNCTIAQHSEFARKHYFYPDLPKGFQTTQSDKPICTDGSVNIRLDDGSTKVIRIERIHMEEDAGKNIHATGTNESFVDLNRAGTPLIEIVSRPDICNAAQATAYLKTLRSIVTYLGICSGNMEEGAFRADTNLSIKLRSATELGTRCELKNINSFKFIRDAIEYEAERQIKKILKGEKIVQETRLWDTVERKTKSMRSKEDAADYRYFREPDLPVLKIDKEWVQRIKDELPELPEQKFERLCSQNNLSAYEADILIYNPEVADYYEQAYAITPSKNLINLVLRDIMAHLKDQKITVKECKIAPKQLCELVAMLDNGAINNRAARTVFDEMAENGGSPGDIVKAKGLEQIGSSQEIEVIVKAVIDASPDQLAAYRSGKDRLFGYFVGQVMKKTGGNANPKIVQELLKKHLSAE
ncbi:Asp-tRNA(Asn)/Glu-tRNA(Gln) amidotransferase subunit GatB [bacterium]|jgi:aspartyl-tRNA(Asn)/glutamyl-tRNA(Gln) amidotransferase subunit B|nr:Asp-tRNA(Asn)/Glu-tRNA(Gln) amidotransferase subunit GatB [bacterium]MBT3903490.1 Asp-tRNA(Asn)/Glu-tRNA(Gln) amidotransferase subunit GatB [bacterium]MBT5346244.1 Asp-tRNA(Asn)/Glu-tRNA(Gln) amidotransferase subunit GatB [bacterium]MBT6131040.1 Asp-tRNA(Asn)/Glu-tRNA(Gln) amidotransferase subunit GatB [bacterium]MBT6528992.1 Asp-tRNA(Asn)/Glu-tRNA(Gln) amidotransferase subunit GatB [bacterium]